MKKIVKKIRDKFFKEVDARFNTVDKNLDVIKTIISKNVEESVTSESRLKEALKKVEHYQPLYGLDGLIKAPARDSRDRADAVYLDLESNISGIKMLDIGSSLGYIPFYFSERGSECEGWDMRPENVEVCQLVKTITGSSAEFRVREFDTDSVKSLKGQNYDVVTIFSVLHHTIAYNGLEYTQKLMKALTDNIPVIYTELALKGEDKRLFWDKHLPEDELEIFKLCTDIDIVKIGEFGTHLSKIKRPLYKISKNTVEVNKKLYNIESRKFKAYKGSSVSLQRSYVLSNNAFIKRYSFKSADIENKIQITNELNFLLRAKKMNIKELPEIVDFEINEEEAKVVLNRIKGELVSEVHNLDTEKLAEELVKVLSKLEEAGWYHNDIRSWNVMTDKNKFYLIDFGMVGPKEIENGKIAFLWLLWSVAEGQKEYPKTGKSELPPKSAVFSSSKFIENIYNKVAQNSDVTFKELIRK